MAGADRPSGYVMTLEAHRARTDELAAAHSTEMAALRATATGLLDELIAWFGAPDWLGPQLPLPLARRIAEFLEAGDAGVAAGPQATPDQVLWVGELGKLATAWQGCGNHETDRPERIVRVVAVPTDHEDQP